MPCTMDVAEARLLALLRLADARAGGFPNERQIALEKASALARDAGMRIENIAMAHGWDISDLRRPGPLGTMPPSREDCAGIYRIAGFRHYDGPANRHRIQIGDPVTLLKVTGNPHDRFAVFVTWNGLDLGYVPRDRNSAV